MALFNCPECNNKVSDKAISCPSCGFPVGEYVKTQSFKTDTVYSNEISSKEYIINLWGENIHLNSDKIIGLHIYSELFYAEYKAKQKVAEMIVSGKGPFGELDMDIYHHLLYSQVFKGIYETMVRLAIQYNSLFNVGKSESYIDKYFREYRDVRPYQMTNGIFERCKTRYSNQIEEILDKYSPSEQNEVVTAPISAVFSTSLLGLATQSFKASLINAAADGYFQGKRMAQNSIAAKNKKEALNLVKAEFNLFFFKQLNLNIEAYSCSILESLRDFLLKERIVDDCYYPDNTNNSSIEDLMDQLLLCFQTQNNETKEKLFITIYKSIPASVLFLCEAIRNITFSNQDRSRLLSIIDVFRIRQPISKCLSDYSDSELVSLFLDFMDANPFPYMDIDFVKEKKCKSTTYKFDGLPSGWKKQRIDGVNQPLKNRLASIEEYVDDGLGEYLIFCSENFEKEDTEYMEYYEIFFITDIGLYYYSEEYEDDPDWLIFDELESCRLVPLGGNWGEFRYTVKGYDKYTEMEFRMPSDEVDNISKYLKTIIRPV